VFAAQAARCFRFRRPRRAPAAETEAQREARWRADKLRCLRGFRSNEDYVLAAEPEHRQALLALYEQEAAKRYGAEMAGHMAKTLRQAVRGDGID
jgi:hypothetical protein